MQIWNALRENRLLALLVGGQSLVIMVAVIVHLGGSLPLAYSWARTLTLFAQALTDSYFIVLSFIVLVAATLRAKCDRYSPQRGNWRGAALVTALLCAVLLLVPSAYQAWDMALLAPSAMLFFLFLRDRNLSHALFGLIVTTLVLVVVSYAFTIIKSQLFVGRVALDLRIIDAEVSLFGRPLYLMIADWSRLQPGVVALCDWVYFLFFHHMALTALFLFAIGDRGDQWRYVLSLTTCYLLGALTYYLCPALGPAFYSPSSFDYLTVYAEFTTYIQDLLRTATEASRRGSLEVIETYAFIACMPSLHMAHETIMLFYARRSLLMLALSLTFWCASFVAVLVLGWHYLFDVLAGIVLAAIVLMMVQRLGLGRSSPDDR